MSTQHISVNRGELFASKSSERERERNAIQKENKDKNKE
jgi:hypothetical protein